MSGKNKGKFSTKELKKFIEDKNACVTVHKSVLNLALYPYHLADTAASIRDILDRKCGKYDKNLNGILLGYKNLKVTTQEGAIVTDSCFIHMNIAGDFYIFKPEIGSVLSGTVIKKTKGHVGCLVHSMFNVSVPYKYDDGEKVKCNVDVGEVVTLKVTYMNLEEPLPYIRASLVFENSQNSHKIFNDDEEENNEFQEENAEKKNPKLKNKQIDLSVDKEENLVNISTVDKKKKNKKAINNDSELQEVEEEITEFVNEETLDLKKSKGKKYAINNLSPDKKNKKKKEIDDSELLLSEIETEFLNEETTDTEKRKSKKHLDESVNNLLPNKKKKKKKEVDDNESQLSEIEIEFKNIESDTEKQKSKKHLDESVNSLSPDKKKRKREKGDNKAQLSEFEIELINEEISDTKKRKGKKHLDGSINNLSSDTKKKNRVIDNTEIENESDLFTEKSIEITTKKQKRKNKKAAEENQIFVEPEKPSPKKSAKMKEIGDSTNEEKLRSINEKNTAVLSKQKKRKNKLEKEDQSFTKEVDVKRRKNENRDSSVDEKHKVVKEESSEIEDRLKEVKMEGSNSFTKEKRKKRNSKTYSDETDFNAELSEILKQKDITESKLNETKTHIQVAENISVEGNTEGAKRKKRKRDESLNGDVESKRKKIKMENHDEIIDSDTKTKRKKIKTENHEEITDSGTKTKRKRNKNLSVENTEKNSEMMKNSEFPITHKEGNLKDSSHYFNDSILNSDSLKALVGNDISKIKKLKNRLKNGQKKSELEISQQMQLNGEAFSKTTKEKIKYTNEEKMLNDITKTALLKRLNLNSPLMADAEDRKPKKRKLSTSNIDWENTELNLYDSDLEKTLRESSKKSLSLEDSSNKKRNSSSKSVSRENFGESSEADENSKEFNLVKIAALNEGTEANFLSNFEEPKPKKAKIALAEKQTKRSRPKKDQSAKVKTKRGNVKN